MTAEVSKITKSVPYDLTFIFIEISEKANGFVKVRPVLEMKNVTSFIKTFLLKTRLHKNA